jgi:hypothetical protein
VKTLAGEREIEYAYVDKKLPGGPGLALDLGPDGSLKVTKVAIRKGWQVIAIGLEQIGRLPGENFLYVNSDFIGYDVGNMFFDYVLCISTIEHFGLQGRYGVKLDEPDLDLLAMQKLLRYTGTLILTIPVGRDAVCGSWHRIYGESRFPKLLDGWEILQEQFWAKPYTANVYEEVCRGDAFKQESTIDPFYYAVGTLIARPAK